MMSIESPVLSCFGGHFPSFLHSISCYFHFFFPLLERLHSLVIHMVMTILIVSMMATWQHLIHSFSLALTSLFKITRSNSGAPLMMSPHWISLPTLEGHCESRIMSQVFISSYFPRWGTRYDYGTGKICNSLLNFATQKLLCMP